MMLKSKLVAFAGALILAGTVFSAQEAVCPNINDIKAEGLSVAEEMGPGLYLSYHISDYNTSTNWGFVVAPIEANSNDMALDVANEVLDNMNAPGIPEADRNVMVCLYETNTPFVYAAAIQNDFFMSPMQLKQYLPKAR